MMRGLLITGIALIVAALVLFIVGAYAISRSFKPLTTTVTLNPGENETIGVATPGRALTMYYTDSINKPLRVYTNESGFMATTYRAGYYVVVFTILNGTSALYLINNYSAPVTVKYSIVNLALSSSIVSGVLVIVSIVVGIIGVILIILGLVLRSSK
ncbi:hypothetical protein [Caldivirga maquilingensis]|uniref:Uncharacterized protein n=1 Tax=Caldivirga maquilingensis (strain ATCC 700844 / DSM 13496 / JCM 10307 / IC-167) TaxID=397948 RepID=A8MDK9_CALMQ|nr:hypothetical protein [Caldivirga maquilingensis]ABW01865.1 hypothetical protein Cmaq_1036 [Caldivirga maquilingensis IC-167]